MTNLRKFAESVTKDKSLHRICDTCCKSYLTVLNDTNLCPRCISEQGTILLEDCKVRRFNPDNTKCAAAPVVCNKFVEAAMLLNQAHSFIAVRGFEVDEYTTELYNKITNFLNDIREI